MTEEHVQSGATFSNDRSHRYALWRIWDDTLPLVMFIGLNPSTANENETDPTIRSVTRICKHNDYGGFYMMNCWAHVSTDPKGLLICDATNEINNKHIEQTALKCKDVVFAWGNFDVVKKHGRDKELAAMFPSAKALHLNKNGSPKHPLYCKSESILVQFNNTKTP